MLWLILGFLAGYLTCWWFRYRPFAKYVERKAAEMRVDVGRIKVAQGLRKAASVGGKAVAPNQDKGQA